MTALTDAMRRTLDGYARSFPGTSDPAGMIVGLARQHGLKRSAAVTAYRQWERDPLAAHRRAERLRALAGELHAAALVCEDAAGGGADVLEVVRALRGVKASLTIALATLEPEALTQTDNDCHGSATLGDRGGGPG